jgi:hypothetical protein
MEIDPQITQISQIKNRNATVTQAFKPVPFGRQKEQA